VHGGTLLLDDVGSLPLSLQAMLLRVLQERTFERVGGSHSLHADVRIIASTHQRLSDLVETRVFREDLFYCLHVVPVVVPPLRERQEDLPLLVRHFLAKYNQAFGRQVPGITRDALAVLGRYSWPGNVRELENLIARLVASSRSRVLEVWDLPAEIHATSHRLLHLPMVVAEVERHTLEGALRQAQGNRSEAARLVGMSRANFYRKLKRYGLLPLAREG
jgi:DNA-binding NtrC family response regulator